MASEVRKLQPASPRLQQNARPPSAAMVRSMSVSIGSMPSGVNVREPVPMPTTPQSESQSFTS